MSHTQILPSQEKRTTLRNFIAGEWRPSHAEASEPVFNPATGEGIARVPLGDTDDVKAAVDAASGAFQSWRDTPVPERVQYLFRFKHQLEDNFSDLAKQVVLENGKTIDDARGEVRRAIEVVDFACGMPTLIMGETVEQIARGIDSHTTRVPLGVVAGICPFNFPAMIPMWMVPIAIAAGNTFVLKPSERTPITAARMFELLDSVGLPKGVVNLVNGARETVAALLTHPDVRAISFVGSAPVAKYIYETAAANGKRVQALAGAKNHLLVMPDADMQLATKAIMSSAFGAAGQRCLAGSVVVTIGNTADQVVHELRDQASKLKLGDGLQQDTAMGPLVRTDSCRRVLHYIDQGVKEGATLVLDGRKLSQPDSSGFFLGATIFDHVRPEMAIAREEVFGPVLSVIRARDLDEAIAVANKSSFGNAASLFTTSGPAARQFRTQIGAGMLGINIGVAAPMAFFPFAGWKGSFFGDLHATGKDGVRFFTETKVVIERW
jgi:malonate-semialdehyde dehydrogenase (acetylating) / methylmalonate-semialdehyde dehydrogenase